MLIAVGLSSTCLGMAEEVGDSSTLLGNVSAPIGAAILLVIGEPLSDDHRELILADITKGKFFQMLPNC